MARITVGVFDAQPLFLVGIAHALNADPGMKLVAEGGSASEAFRLSSKLSPDVVVLDSSILEDGHKLARSITAIAGVKLLILSFSMAAKQAREAFAAGAKGYVFKGVSGRDLCEAIRAVHRGEGYVSPALAAEMMLNQADLQESKKQNPLAQLTSREEKIFALLCTGLKNQEIGARLNVAERTVKHYVTRIFEMLNVRNRVEAAALASQHGSTIEGLKPSWSTLPNGMPVLFSAKGRAEADSEKAIVRNRLLATHSATGNAPPEPFSKPTPSEKAAAAKCFSAIFGSVPEDAGSEVLGTCIVLPRVILPTDID